MNQINLNKTFPSKVQDAKNNLKELRCKNRELNIRHKLGMPMTDDELYQLQRIGADIEQIEFLIEWMEEVGEDDWVV